MAWRALQGGVYLGSKSEIFLFFPWRVFLRWGQFTCATKIWKFEDLKKILTTGQVIFRIYYPHVIEETAVAPADVRCRVFGSLCIATSHEPFLFCSLSRGTSAHLIFAIFGTASEYQVYVNT